MRFYLFKFYFKRKAEIICSLILNEMIDELAVEKNECLPNSEKASFNLISKLIMHFIGGSRGRRRRAPPQTGSNSFVFAYVFAEKHPRQRSAPPQQLGAPQREILDPPLHLLMSA